MPARLRDRQKQIPGGFKFYQPETGWKPPRYASFQTIVQGLITNRKGNKALLEKHKWAIDKHAVEDEVDAFNAKVCLHMGWTDYVQLPEGDSPPPPKMSPAHSDAPSAAGVSMVGGAKALLEMFGPSHQPVSRDEAESRALICVSCPKNDQGDWTRHFTAPASMVIRKMLGIVKDLNLETTYDQRLQICSVCYCPLKTKVWADLNHIKAHLPADVKAKLPPHCWILK